MELREFMSIFRPINNNIRFFGETAGITMVKVQLAAAIEKDVKNFAVAMKETLGKERKHEIQNAAVPDGFVLNLVDLIINLPTKVLF